MLWADEQSDPGTQPDQSILPLRPGPQEKATYDYQRNGTATLFAELEIATG